MDETTITLIEKLASTVDTGNWKQINEAGALLENHNSDDRVAKACQSMAYSMQKSLDEIDDLKAEIKYLEDKLYGLERGFNRGF